jgi:hypothetical protein
VGRATAATVPAPWARPSKEVPPCPIVSSRASSVRHDATSFPVGAKRPRAPPPPPPGPTPDPNPPPLFLLALSRPTGELPVVVIEYDKYGKRVQKHFEDAYEARRFYLAKHKAGKRPNVLRAPDRPPRCKRCAKPLSVYQCQGYCPDCLSFRPTEGGAA